MSSIDEMADLIADYMSNFSEEVTTGVKTAVLKNPTPKNLSFRSQANAKQRIKLEGTNNNVK